MRSTTLLDLVNDSAWLVNISTPTATSSVNITDARKVVNAGIAEWFLLTVQAVGEKAFEKRTTFALTPGTSLYPLPLDFFSLKSVAALYDTAGSRRSFLTPYTLAERPALMDQSLGGCGEPLGYREAGKSVIGSADVGWIELLPAGSALNVELLYIYGPTVLTQDADTLDGFAGFEDYVRVFAGRRFAMRTEQRERVAELSMELDRLKANILGGMRQRDAASCPRVSMTRGERVPGFGRTRRVW